MQGDPQRPYAQLLTPAAKSQKLLLRLQHKKLLSPADLSRTQAAFALWQKLLAKNIPSTVWPHFADLLLFPEEEYIALLLWPFENRLAVQTAIRWRHLQGLLLVDQRDHAAPLSQQFGHLVIAMALADRIGEQAWVAASRQLTSWQLTMMDALGTVDQDAALDLLGLFRQQSAAPWTGLEPTADLVPSVNQIYFCLWRARGQVVVERTLLKAHSDALAAVQWLNDAAHLVTVVEEGYRLSLG